MKDERYNVLVREVVQYIKHNNIEDVAELLNDLKFDVLETLYEQDNDIKVVKRGVKIEPFSKEKLSENLAISSDYVSNDLIGEALDTDDIFHIVNGIVDEIQKDRKKVISSDQVVLYTKKYLKDHGYSLALEGYGDINAKEGRKYES